MDDQRKLRRISGFLFVAALVALIVHFLVLTSFNQRTDSVHGSDADSPVRMELAEREGNTGSWVKRDFDLGGKLVDITGTTFDGMLSNGSNEAIADWSLRINIGQDCFINQAWNGEVEIHQFVGTAREKVQRLNLQDFDLADVTLENMDDDDLLIPLEQGDFVVYFPSARFKETPLEAGDSVEIGLIFYYLDSIDLSDFDLEYNSHREFTQGPTFYVFALLLGLWLLAVLMSLISAATYRRAQGEMELRKSILSCMSDLYALIYIVDLVEDDMVSVSVVEGATHEYRKGSGARKFLLDGTESGVAPAYQAVMREFVDLDTIAERLKDRDSIAREFVSRTHGWSRMRFFAMDRVEGRPLEKVIFTVQDINDDKNELIRVEERVGAAEAESKEKSVFLANVSREIKEPIREMVDLGGKIARESGEDRVRAYADDLQEAGGSLLLLIDGIADYSELETGEMKLASAGYSLKRLLLDVVDGVRSLTGGQQVAFELDVSEMLPDGLRGDEDRLKRVIGNLLVIGAAKVGAGSVKLSVYGKAFGEKAHLLVSVKAVCPDGAGADAEGRVSFTSASMVDIGMDLAAGLLGLMGSELKEVHSNGRWAEYYFEVEQDIVDATAVGEIG